MTIVVAVQLTFTFTINKFKIENCISYKKWSSACQKLFQMRLMTFFCLTN